MTEREWKPGDVAYIAVDGVGSYLAMWCADQYWVTCAYVERPRRGDGGGHTFGSSLVSDIRPIALIDPEDREAVERLRDVWDAAYSEQTGMTLAGRKGDRGNALQAALREFADPKPPKCEGA